MKLALQVFSWIAVTLGVLAIIGGFSDMAIDPSGAQYSLAGGALFLVEGVLALTYIKSHQVRV